MPDIPMMNCSPRRCFLAALLATVGVCCSSSHSADPPIPKDKSSVTAPTFADDIRPLFQAKCSKCHGEKVRKADLDLTTPGRNPQGRRIGAGGRPRQAGREPALRESPSRRDAPEEGGATDGWRNRYHPRAGSPPARRRKTRAKRRTKSLSTTSSRSCCAIAPRATAGTGRRMASTCGRRPPCFAAASRARHRPRQAGREPPSSRRSAPDRCRPRSGWSRRASSPSSRPRLELLARWIAAGAPEVAVEPDVATTKPDPLVTDKDRDFWAFRPPQAGRRAGGARCRSRPQSDRRVRAAKAGGEGARLLARGRPGRR